MPGVKLLDQVREQLCLKHYSHRTEATSLHWIKRYILFHDKRHPLDEIREPRGNYKVVGPVFSVKNPIDG